MPKFHFPPIPSLKYTYASNQQFNTFKKLRYPRKAWREIQIKINTHENQQEYGKITKHWDKMMWRQILLPGHWLSKVSSSPQLLGEPQCLPPSTHTGVQCQRMDFLKDKFGAAFLFLRWHQTWLLFPGASLQLRGWGTISLPLIEAEIHI